MLRLCYSYCVHVAYLGSELKKDSEYQALSEQWSGGVPRPRIRFDPDENLV